MDCRAQNDVFFLIDEKFDFDVSLSPASSKGDEDEDEVFVGPVGHVEKCVSANVASLSSSVGGGVRTSWSPLNGEQMEAMCQEAQTLAGQLQRAGLLAPPPRPDEAPGGDSFSQGAEAQLGAIDRGAAAPSPVKRQTFCVQDSPMKQLPPAIRHRLLTQGAAATAAPARPASTAATTSARPGTTPMSARPAASARPAGRAGASSPAARPPPRMGLRGKATLGAAVVLPSKPAAAAALPSAAVKRRAERLQPPSKPTGGWRRSPSSRAGSCDDLLSDSASVASDISDSSLNSSLLGKRSMAPPTKRALGNLSGVKAPPLQRMKVTERKNTSSSSSSVSSFNSSLSLSPATGKANSSLNRSQSSSVGPAPNRPASHSRPRRSTTAAAEPAPSTAGRRSLSLRARKLSEAEHVKAPVSTPLHMTPAKRATERAASTPPAASTRLHSGLKNKSRPEAPVLPTPSGRVRGVAAGALRPNRPPSVSGVDSRLPQKATSGPLTPSAAAGRALPLTTRRPSALPTPVRRRTSAIPVATPTRRPPTFDFDPASVRREMSCSPAPEEAQEAEPVHAPDVQPFCLEEGEEPPAAPPTSPPQPDQSTNSDPQDDSQHDQSPMALESTEKSKKQEVLLLDLPAPTPQPHEKLLIDLTNTPDLIRTSATACAATQLIDLSSPLIKWSPEEKRENNAPLINLSF
ncbi:gtse1 [Pungitius sinensis]